MARVKDLWWTAGTPRRKTPKHPDNGGNRDAKRWLAVWLAPDGRERTKACATKEEARRYGARKEADAERGVYVSAQDERTTVGSWCDTWLKGYRGRVRASTARQAAVHIAHIKDGFDEWPVRAVKSSDVSIWLARLKDDELATSFIYAIYSRFGQIMNAAVREGLIHRSPCHREIAPSMGSQRPYVATTDQLWALYDAMGERYRIAVLLGGLAGLRCGEACGLRVDEDIDAVNDQILPAVQWPAEPLKTETSQTGIPVPKSLVDGLLAHAKEFTGKSGTLLTNAYGQQLHPRQLERHIRTARGKVPGLPKEFRFQDLRHYFASMLIASGADVKTVQARLRHASGKTTLDVYGHLWPDRDQSTRDAVDEILGERNWSGTGNGADDA